MSGPQKEAKRKTKFSVIKGDAARFTPEQAHEKYTRALTQKATSRLQQKREVKIVTDNAANGAQKRERRAAMTAGPVTNSVAPILVANYDAQEDMEAKQLEAHLIRISPFNDRWNIERTISAGTFGVAFFVIDKETGTRGVIKVARNLSDGTGNMGNSSAEWESFILERIFKTNPNANIVRLLDKGMLLDQDDNNLEFMVCELCDVTIRGYIGDAVNLEDRRWRVCRIALGSLKGLFDLHKQGLLHRDVKPDNMGMIKQHSETVCVLYDLGCARFFTDGHGFIRPPRTTVNFAGTEEWASGNALKGRDQTRFDDLIGWFYVVVELFDPESHLGDDDSRPFPWDYIEHTKAMHHLKSVYAPARLMLRHCPSQLYTINTYLQCSNRNRVPDYSFIANLMESAMHEAKRKSDFLKRQEKQPKRATMEIGD